jgi:ATP/maltotriose-dependent transcriptional regulator MalT
MAEYNADFWEVQTGSAYLESQPLNRGLWYETEEDRARRYAFQDFFEEVRPVVRELIDGQLTRRQKEVVKLYYIHGKTQEDIAAILNLSQSTVSRHLFGTVRQGKKVGGAIPKLQKVMAKANSARIDGAFGILQTRLAEAV